MDLPVGFLVCLHCIYGYSLGYDLICLIYVGSSLEFFILFLEIFSLQ